MKPAMNFRRLLVEHAGQTEKRRWKTPYNAGFETLTQNRSKFIMFLKNQNNHAK